MFPLFSSEEAIKNSRFKSAYRLSKKILEAFEKGENMNGHIVIDILYSFLHAVDETEVLEAVANLMWVIFLWWTQINDIQKLLVLQNKLLSKRIDVNDYIIEY